MTPLGRRLVHRIARHGPITLADYMAEALTHPELGYYTTGDPFGAAGDFTTAPEISQMFGELLGLWCVDCWQRLGAPDPVLLVELGPGRGTLMADALRAAKLATGFLEAVEIHLVEASPLLRKQQRQALADHRPDWHDNLGEVPEGPLLVLANEFFDALPVHQYERGPQGWCERLVVLGPDGVRVVVGASGGRRITNCVTQLIVKLLDYGMGPQEAIDSPRVDCSTPATSVDPRLDEAVRADLESRGYGLVVIGDGFMQTGFASFASPAAIVRHEGELRAGVDTFHSAYAAGL